MSEALATRPGRRPAAVVALSASALCAGVLLRRVFAACSFALFFARAGVRIFTFICAGFGFVF